MDRCEEKDTRVVISHAGISENHGDGNSGGSLLRLRHPKSGNPTTYSFYRGCLQEFHWFKQCYSSWFLGNYVSEDGSLYAATPVDLVFILLPIFDEARMKRGNDLGKFRQLEEIMFVDGFPGYQHLVFHAADCMQVVCEVKDIGSLKFFRLDDSKVLAWLLQKVGRTKLALQRLDNNYAVQDEKDAFRDIISLMGEYLTDEPWLKLLSNHLGVDMQKAAKAATGNENISMSGENSPSSFESVQMKNFNGKNTSVVRRQSKRLKPEVGSLNIKDMFRKARNPKS
ncbi:hypothetical protein H6P81_012801 [Aristolochia fimbriata]|uniref:Ribonuclease H2 subunit B n=1 Tax=Aristolochia fimbriata TaxID=158543 RepID=A0AAV7EHH7_ARIFI|nr:hypothetical protein H6P81_012801 [Aristolochia fimbriata]